MNSPNKSMGKAISTDDAIRAAKDTLVIATANGIRAAVCGGLAMHIYGFTRATKDIDFIADRGLGLPVRRELSFGGCAYDVVIDGKSYEVDWILRNDDQKGIYDQALIECINDDESGLPIVSPEWMVIIKHVAGRGKDHLDCVWLLRQDGLVDRPKMISIIKRIMGAHAFWAIKDIESTMLEADLMKAKDEMNE